MGCEDFSECVVTVSAVCGGDCFEWIFQVMGQSLITESLQNLKAQKSEFSVLR